MNGIKTKVFHLLITAILFTLPGWYNSYSQAVINFTNPTDNATYTITEGNTVSINVTFDQTIIPPYFFVNNKLTTESNTYTDIESGDITINVPAGNYSWKLEVWASTLQNHVSYDADVVNFSVVIGSWNITADNNFDALNGTHGEIKVDNTTQTAPYSFSKNTGETTTLEALRQIDENNYVRDWNVTALNLRSKWDREEPSGGVTYMGENNPLSFAVTADDNNSTYKANLRILYQISRNDQTEFDDVISEGVQAEIFEQNSGDITAPATLTPGSITYNFAGWTDDFTAPNPRTITPDNNETFTALYKYPHHSNYTEAYKNNSQRKFVQTPDGTMYVTYGSMGSVWVEKSTDNGQTWDIMNNGKPLNTDEAKLPSMDYRVLDNAFVVVWQEKWGTGYKIRYAVYSTYNNTFRIDDVNWEPPGTNFEDLNANPVVG